MGTYQNFLNHFSMFNKERLDGLTEMHFSGMTQQEREMAFDYLLRRVEKGGTAETVNGIFTADFERALLPLAQLMESGALNEEAQLAAASNIFQITGDKKLLPIFIRFMSNTNKHLRGTAARCVPLSFFSEDLRLALETMIKAETDKLARIHAVNALLLYHDINKETVGKRKYSNIYRNLHSEDLLKIEEAFREIERQYD
ncbi:hypothetical protein JOD97_005518 [Duganella sp. 1411]|uniref:HEAT repeat domain-containing protein n=1 Tax=Duganella sp. 1411 TaxID=2806572 RepID=UPI001AEA0ADF|nr:HEAT repeat domain-containing protein [Duganella sp. 1411]MBP1207438.1 hypothetical protein [Duganella sp. 1411]